MDLGFEKRRARGRRSTDGVFGRLVCDEAHTTRQL